MNIKNDLTQLIGNTPMVYLTNFAKAHELKSRIALKLEYMNPLGSIKDRAAFAMIVDGEKRGVITPGTVIIEPTSGNTGIGLAFVCAARGYRLILTMPDSMSQERRMLLAALGAELVLTEGALGMNGAVEKAKELAAQHPSAFIPQQFENPANPTIHAATTAKEILRDTDGRVDFLVSAFGTGGTISGTGRALKQANPMVKIIGVEPAESPLVSEGHAGKHGIQGIGANFVPGNLDREVIDEVITVTTEESRSVCREAAKRDGLLLGISSGAAIAAAVKLSQRPGNEDKLIAVICPDGGERYLSTGLFEAE